MGNSEICFLDRFWKKSARGHHHRFPTNRPEGRIAFSNFRPNARICFPKTGQRAESHFSNTSVSGPMFSKILPEGRITFFRNSARGQNNIFPKFGQRAESFFIFKKSARGPNNLFPKIGQRVESHFFQKSDRGSTNSPSFFPKIHQGGRISFSKLRPEARITVLTRGPQPIVWVLWDIVYIYIYIYMAVSRLFVAPVQALRKHPPAVSTKHSVGHVL